MNTLEELQKRDGGLVCNRDSGLQIIIVVDDCYKQVMMQRGRTPHGYGLREIWEQVRTWENTRAIGFFPLPRPKKGTQSLLESIQKWISEVCTENCSYYVLVDVYYGERGSDVNKATGLEFEETWSKLKFQESKVAFLSIAGREENFPNPRKRDLFIKYDIVTSLSNRGQLPPDLLNWFGNQHKLQKLWANTKNWFSAKDSLMQHSADMISDYFFGNQLNIKGNAEKYVNNVQSALGFTIPKTWWSSRASIINIHESLKCLCGAYSCCGNNLGRKPISVGAAYMIALMAHQVVWQNVESLVQAVPNWSSFTKASDALFPLQHHTIAQESVMALYDLFLHLFEPRNTTQSQLNAVIFGEDGNFLQFQLWDAENLSKSISKRIFVSEKNEQNDIQVLIRSSAGDTTDAVLRLWKCMLLSQDGFMSPGVVYMKRNKLIIALTK